MLESSVKERKIAREIIKDFFPVSNVDQEEYMVCKIAERLEEYGVTKWYQGQDDERRRIKADLAGLIHLLEETGAPWQAISPVKLAHDNIKD